MTREEREILMKVLDDIPEPYTCTVCRSVWVVNGRPCDCEGHPSDITKPINMSELKASVDEVLEEHLHPDSRREPDASYWEGNGG